MGVDAALGAAVAVLGAGVRYTVETPGAVYRLAFRWPIGSSQQKGSFSSMVSRMLNQFVPQAPGKIPVTAVW